MVFDRNIYLQRLIDSRGNGMVKIVTGIRRCGKSFLLFTLFRDWLLHNGTDTNHIITFSFDDRRNKKYRNPDTLLDYIDATIVEDKQTTYIILDEIQLVDEFVEVMLSLMHKSNVEVYVSGSNSKFLSSDVVTEFRGRGWEIRVHPLSFAEYYAGMGGDKIEALRTYYAFGGLPQVALMQTRESKQAFLKEILETTYIRDVIQHNDLRNEEGLRQVLQVLSSSIGSSTNTKRIENTFHTEEHLTIKDSTINKYIAHLQEAFIIEAALRYDIKGRKYIGTQTKYYFEDAGIRNAILNFRQSDDASHLMENVIYNELRSRGYSVDVGQVDTWEKKIDGKYIRKNLEVDFVINRGDKRLYIQSAYSMPTIEKIHQEKRPLLHVPDGFQKIIVTDGYNITHYNEDGILEIGLFDFLLDTHILEA